MVLRCRCGGEVRVVSGSDPEAEYLHEHYKCEVCSRTGTFSISPSGSQSKTGCLVSSR